MQFHKILHLSKKSVYLCMGLAIFLLILRNNCGNSIGRRKIFISKSKIKNNAKKCKCALASKLNHNKNLF